MAQPFLHLEAVKDLCLAAKRLVGNRSMGWTEYEKDYAGASHANGGHSLVAHEKPSYFAYICDDSGPESAANLRSGPCHSGSVNTVRFEDEQDLPIRAIRSAFGT